MIDNFVPPDEVERVESRAAWDGEKEVWILPRLELAGNSRRARPVSDSRVVIPESDTVRRRAAYDPSPRFKSENVVALEPDMPERTTIDYATAQMAAMRVGGGGGGGMGGGGGGGMASAAYEEDGAEDADRPRVPRKDRPRTATRKKREDEGPAASAGGGAAAYPVARGLVGRS